jgi:hypothetical protein
MTALDKRLSAIEDVRSGAMHHSIETMGSPRRWSALVMVSLSAEREWMRSIAVRGWKVTGRQVHFFPKQFVSFGRLLPDAAHHLLDRTLATIVYFNLAKD